MTNRPEPASLAIAAKLRALADWFDRADARGVFGAKPADEVQRDLRAWADAVSNAPALEARVKQLEDALREIGGGGDISSTARIFRQVGIWRDIARKALEQ